MSKHVVVPDRLCEEEGLDPAVEARLNFEAAARRLDLEDWIVRRLSHMERELAVNLPLVTDDGTAALIAAWRVQHTTSRGPVLGGLRLSPAATLSQARADAMATTWECALFDLPFGGAAGALVCDPQRLSERELRDLVKELVESMRGLIGPETDVFTPDVGSNRQIAAWIFDGYVRMAGTTEPAVVTGKPAELWGLPDCDGMAACGLCLLAQVVLRERRLPLDRARVAVQGFGKLGAGVARWLHDAGARVVAIADLSGGLWNEHGLDIPELQAYAETNRLIFGFPEATPVSNTEVLDSDCDVLIAAASEHQITAEVAGLVRAGMVVEAVKQAITAPADHILEERGVLVVPDMLANGTRLLPAFAEWNQNRQHAGCLTAEEMEERVKGCVERAYAAVRYVATRDRSSLRAAAELLAVDRVAAVMRLRA